MTPQEFGMWGLSVLVWLFVAFFATWGYAAVRSEKNKFWLEEQLRLRFLEQVDREELEIEIEEE
jgi:hypothetical protein